MASLLLISKFDTASLWMTTKFHIKCRHDKEKDNAYWIGIHDAGLDIFEERSDFCH